MDTTRAKFQCQQETRHNGWNARTFRFQAIYDQGLVDEDRSFAKATPSGTLEIQVDNPNVQFELGAFYYLDLTKVEQEATAQ